ncbi:MAG: hypothetical protein EOP04_31870, partial [Proteobacteria bacterium]
MKDFKKIVTPITSSLLLTMSLLPTGCGKDSDKSSAQSATVENDKAVLNERLDKKSSDVPFTPASEEGASFRLLDTFAAVQVAGLTA